MSSEETRQEIVPAGNGQIVRSAGRLVPLPGTPLVNCPTNLDGDVGSMRTALIKGTSPGDLDAELHAKGYVSLRLRYFLCFPDERTDEETGEVNQFTRTVLYDMDGRTLRLSSAHAPQRICHLMEMFSPEEWEEGIPIRVSIRKSRRNREYADIQLDQVLS